MKLKIYKKNIGWLLLSVVLIVIDQLSKWYIKANYLYLEKSEVITDFFYITHHKNSGAAWGIFQDATLALAILSGIVTVVLIVFMLSMEHKMAVISLGVIIAGAIGNLIDRAIFMEVTDFLDFYIFSYDFPIFNVADMCVVIGTILLSIYILFIYKEEPKKDE